MAVEGVSLEWHGDELLKVLASEMEKRLAVVGEVVRGEAVRSLRRKKFPPSSLPNTTPAWRTGHLFRSVQYEVGKGQFTVRIGTNVRYGLYLEVGTSKMAPRPWLRPALEKSRKRIVGILAKPLPLK
jgi:HK97 gp10 family phage protein